MEYTLKQKIENKIKLDIFKLINTHVSDYEKDSYESDSQLWVVDCIISEHFKYNFNLEEIFMSNDKISPNLIQEIANAGLILKEMAYGLTGTNDIAKLYKEVMMKQASYIYAGYQVTIEDIIDKTIWKLESLEEDIEETNGEVIYCNK